MSFQYKPTVCVWELTLACNLRCGHCGSKAGKARANEMTTAECLGVVDSLAQLDCEVITLSGGEPTLRPDWQDIAHAIRDQGMLVNMVTNGINLDAEMATKMKSAGLCNVAVSIDGPRDVHDQIRGRGTFAKTSRAIRTLKDSGMSATMMTTINSQNLHRLQETYDVAVELGADRWRTQLGKPMGNMNDEMVIQPRDLLTVLPKLYDIGLHGPISVGIGDSVGYYGPYDSQLRSTSWKGKPQQWSGCQAGMRAIGIEADGGVKGCLSMQAFGNNGADPFLEGNIRQRSLESIWHDPNAFAYNRNFSVNDLSGFCRRCPHQVRCRGGARCVSAAACGNISEDPYCYFRVANLATRWPTMVSRASAATAASLMTMFLGGCGLVEQPLNLRPSAEQQCEEVCCDCTQTPAAVKELCCEPAIQVDYGEEPIACEEVCCECDYGVLPQDVLEECCEPPPQPITCEEVCCECDYGVLPQGVFEECCEPPPQPIACEDVCCECDYGVLPQEVAQACCNAEPEPTDCTNVCCDCDYGMAPPPECCDEGR